jgi:hypothetical protein
LNRRNLFPNCVLNLISFSLGTQVVLSCLEEMQKMGVRDIFNEVVLLGGVANIENFLDMGKIN